MSVRAQPRGCRDRAGAPESDLARERSLSRARAAAILTLFALVAASATALPATRAVAASSAADATATDTAHESATSPDHATPRTAPLAATQSADPAAAAALPPGATLVPTPRGPTEDIRDIRGPKYVRPPWLIPAIIAGVLALALAAYGLWRLRKRGQRPRTLSLFETALKRLEDLRPLMQPVHAREFSIGVSDIVRGYIEQRFDATAAHRTTEEFLRDLLETTHPALSRHRPVLSEFLYQCDLVKFAGVSLSVQNMEALRESARAFVLETAKPEPEVKATTPDHPKDAHDSLPAT